jgi:DNA-binding NarL/FixJ family response regulator
MEKKTVYIVVEGGIVVDAYATCDIDVVVCDLDCPDGDMKEEIEKFVAQLPDFAHEAEIL